MKPHHVILAGALFALAACGQTPAATEEAAPAAPQALIDQVLAMPADRQPVFAWEQLTAYQAAHPEATPACASIRGAESRGIIPDDIDPASFYAAHKGSAVYSVQCGPQLTGTRMDPREHWLVVFAPGAAEPAVVNCADAHGLDQCPNTMARAAAATP